MSAANTRRGIRKQRKKKLYRGYSQDNTLYYQLNYFDNPFITSAIVRPKPSYPVPGVGETPIVTVDKVNDPPADTIPDNPSEPTGTGEEGVHHEGQPTDKDTGSPVHGNEFSDVIGGLDDEENDDGEMEAYLQDKDNQEKYEAYLKEKEKQKNPDFVPQEQPRENIGKPTKPMPALYESVFDLPIIADSVYMM